MEHKNLPTSRQIIITSTREKIISIFEKNGKFEPDTAWYGSDTALIRPWYGPDTPHFVSKNVFLGA